jgi:hypothetical protein
MIQDVKCFQYLRILHFMKFQKMRSLLNQNNLRIKINLAQILKKNKIQILMMIK